MKGKVTEMCTKGHC